MNRKIRVNRGAGTIDVGDGYIARPGEIVVVSEHEWRGLSSAILSGAVTDLGLTSNPETGSRAGVAEVSDEQVAALVTAPLTRAALESQGAAALRSRVVSQISYPGVADTPRAVGLSDGLLWGAIDGSLYRSRDGASWSQVGSSIPEHVKIQRVAPTSDGEVLVAGSREIYRSLGWATNPELATWVMVWQTPTSATFIAPFSLDFNDPSRTTFAVSHYTGEVADWEHSRYVWLSRDAGQTWVVVYDSVSLFGAAAAATSHVHGVCYDSWSGRIWVSEGHETIAGLRWSDDGGETWSKVTRGEVGGITMAPTTLVATPTGICCGSDSIENGVYGVARTSEEPALEWLWQWRTPEGWSGTSGFGQGGYYDPATGQAYIAFQTGYAEVDPPIVLANGVSASLLMVVPTDAPARTLYAAFPTPTGIIAASDILGRERILASLDGRIEPSVSATDRGGVMGGVARSTRSVAVGLGAQVSGFTRESVALGAGAKIEPDAHRSVSVGYNSLARQQRGTAVGDSSEVSGTDAVAIGTASKSPSHSVVVGSGTTLAEDSIYAVAVGSGVSAEGPEGVTVGAGAGGSALSVVVGTLAESTEERAVSVGYRAKAQQPRSVVVGDGAAVHTSSNPLGSVAIGRDSTVTAHGSVSLGSLASTADAGVAIGALSRADHSNSVAIGFNTSTSEQGQVAVGDRHIEIGLSPLPGPPTAGARLLIREVDGKAQLVVQFPTGPAQVVAVEP